LKILFCCEGFLVDGVASFNLYLSSALAEAGHEVAIAGRWAGFNSFKERHKKKGVTVFQDLALTPVSPRLVRQAAGFKPDVIITDSRRAFPLALEIKKRTGGKLVTVFHDPARDDRRKNRGLEIIRAQSDAWITSEEPIFEQLNGLAPPFPVSLIRRPISAMVEPSPLPPRDPFRVFCLGRLSGYKSPGFRALLDRASLLKKRIPSLEVAFAGGGDRLPLYRIEAMKQNALAGSRFVRVLGTVTDPNPLFRWSTVVCAGATSAAEGVLSNRPTFAFSAFWLGLVTEANSGDAIACHFGERYGSFRLKDRPESVLEALESLYGNWADGGVEEIVKQARETLEREFSSSLTASQFETLFRSLSGS
jgi:glycosyltransferase involved in cell wall biosynthesis